MSKGPANDGRQTGSPAAVFGLRLRVRREELGLALTDIEAATKIRTHYLGALEAGRPEMLPGPVYALGFARAYAEYLGLSGDEAIQQLRMALGLDPDPPKAAAAVLPVLSDDPEPALLEVVRPAKPGRKTVRGTGQRRRVVASGNAGARAVRRPRRTGVAAARTGGGFRRWWLVALVVVILAGALYVAYSAWQAAKPIPGNGGNGGAPNGGGDPGGGGTEPPVLTIDDISLATGATGSLEVVVDWHEMIVSLRFRERVWLRWEADGELFFEGFAAAGQIITGEPSDDVLLRIGRARQTELTISGVPVGPAGAADDSRTVQIVRRR